MIPDYVLSALGRYIVVIDAKGPREVITSGRHVEQAYSYAVHPEIRAPFFALCNGKQFALFETSSYELILVFSMSDTDEYWPTLKKLIGVGAFRKRTPEKLTAPGSSKEERDYLSAKQPTEITNFQKQGARRHHGVHGYFTRQIWSVVQHYIETFSRPGDMVLDPFGGSGVTLLESIVLGRRAAHVDINPLSTFVVRTLITPVDLSRLKDDYQHVHNDFERLRPHSDAEVAMALAMYSYPKGIALPKGSDVDYIEDLFTKRHLAELALLKHLIGTVSDESSREHLRLMFSGALNKANLTYHASSVRSEYGGDSGIFRYYRYRIAPKPPELDLLRVFTSRFKKIIAAKEELRPFLAQAEADDCKVIRGSATNLSFIEDQSVDYIYTDPPYGAKIPYLDLSTLWNAWLDLGPMREDFELEAIEGGELDKKKGEYADLLAQSIQEMYRVLKFDRWMSFVFAHRDPAFWHIIIGAAEGAGFEYAGVVKQSNGQPSFKKRQNPYTVLSGQLIINFRKVLNPKTIMLADLGLDIVDRIEETVEKTIALNHGATIDKINEDLIIAGLEQGFLHILSAKYKDISPILTERFSYDEATGKYYIRKDAKFKSKIDVRLRIHYYLLSFMRGKQLQGINPSFDDVVLSIMPLLRNGITPENQTILSVLEGIAAKDKDGRWQLRDDGQGTFKF